MTRTSHAALLAGLLLALPPLALGEDLLQIYDLAVQSDPTLKEAGAQLNATREVKPQAKALLLPNIGIQGEVNYNNIRTRTTNLNATFTNSDNYVDGSLNPRITQTVYDRAKWITLKQTDNTIAAAEAQYRSAEIDLMANTTVAYFEILRRADAVRVSESLVRANERTLDQSKQRFEVGLVAITDVNESQAAFDLSRANLILAQNALDTSWEALRQIVGPIKVPLSRLGDKLPLAPPEPNSIDKWAEAALAGNYGIVAAAEAAEAAKKGIEIQRSGHYPTLEAVAGYDWTRSAADFNTEVDGAFIGLQVKCPDLSGRWGKFAYPPGRLHLSGGPGSPRPAAPRRDQTGQGRLQRHHLLHQRRPGPPGGGGLGAQQPGVHPGRAGGGDPNPGRCPQCPTGPVPGGVRLPEFPLRLRHQRGQAAPGHQHPDPGRHRQGQCLADPRSIRSSPPAH